MSRRLWTRDEFILTFNLYLKLPFGKLHTRTPEIQELALLLGRTVNSIALRLTNFASCDPYHINRGVKGMVGGIKQCQPFWDEFANNREALIFESERILAEKQFGSIENKFDLLYEDIKQLRGETKIREIKTRVNQNIFRDMITANYDRQCAISGIDIPEFLIASHIIPWSKNEKERLNPENGICLSMLYDKAFDRGLIGIEKDYIIIISDKLKKYNKKEYYQQNFGAIDGMKLHLPNKHLPNPLFLEWHRDTIFQK